MKTEGANRNESRFFAGHFLLSLYVLACCILFALLSFYRAIPNWDQLAYVASIHSVSGMSASQLHDEVYSSAKSHHSDDHYNELVAADDYRKTMASDPELFALQLPYYKIRPLFLMMIAGVEQAGFDMFAAGKIISALSCALAGLILFVAFARDVAAPLWLLFPAIFVAAGGYETARLFSPDSIAFLVVALLYLTYRKEHWSFFLVLALSVFVRTDMILLVVICTMAILVYRPRYRVAALSCAVAALIAYQLVNHFAGNYGWAAVFHFVFESNMQATDPRLFQDQTMSPGRYFSTLISRMNGVLYYPECVFAILASGLIGYTLLMQSSSARLRNQSFAEHTISRLKWLLCEGLSQPMMLPVFVSVAYIGGHFALFPLLETRFFVGPYFIILLTLVGLFANSIDTQRNARNHAS